MKDCQCGLCHPIQGKKYHQKWEYDLDKAKKTLCLVCEKLIGEEEYVEDICWARFGQMFLVHKRCLKKIEIKRSDNLWIHKKDLN